MLLTIKLQKYKVYLDHMPRSLLCIYKKKKTHTTHTHPKTHQQVKHSPDEAKK